MRRSNETTFWRHTTMKGPVFDQGAKKSRRFQKIRVKRRDRIEKAPVPSSLFSETRLSYSQPKDYAKIAKGGEKRNTSLKLLFYKEQLRILKR